MCLYGRQCVIVPVYVQIKGFLKSKFFPFVELYSLIYLGTQKARLVRARLPRNFATKDPSATVKPRPQRWL
jgi:hypothetical protein